ncbi:MAG: PAS domain-containing protein [Deltaproteobacteria bacterium]|nr:PAS domain-containing protein [Deltaproteobacteria bacterium]
MSGLEGRLKAGFALALVLLGVAGFISVQEVNLLVDRHADATRARAVRTELEETIGLVLELTTAARGYLLTGDALFQQQHDWAAAQLVEHLRPLEALVPQGDQRARLVRLRPLLAEQAAQARADVEARNAEGAGAVGRLLAAAPGDSPLPRIRALIDEMKEAQLRLSDERERATRAQARQAQAGAALAALLGLVLVGVLLRLLLGELAHRRRTEREALQARAFLDAVVANIPDMIFVKDARDLRFTLFNRAGEELVGHKLADMAGKDVYDLFPRAQADFFTAKDREVLAGRTTVDIPEEPLDTPRGRRILHTRKVPLRDAAGEPAFLLGISEDITDQKAAQEERARLIAIIESSPDMVGLATPDGQVRYVNAAGRRLLGLAPDVELSATSLAEYLPPAGREVVLGRGLPAAIREGVWRGEAPVQTVDGRVISCALVLAAHRNAVGEVEYVSAIIRDITEQKQFEHVLEQRVAERTRELQAETEARQQVQHQLVESQKMEGIGRLAGGVAHDFNNLLSVILSYSELLLEQVRPGDPAREDIEAIQKAGKQAARLTQQLLAFSRRQVLQARVVDLNEVVTGMGRMVGRIVGEDVEVRVATAATGMVRCDSGQVEQALLNLVVNSRDAMPTGGMLTIETADAVLDASYAVTHAGVAAGPYVMLAVSDTGTGMDAATLARVFEPFFTTKEKGKGTGLGLSTAYGIVKQSGGHIFVYSEPDQGTTFKIYLPRTSATDADRPAPARPGARRGTETVLLVEDEEQLRTLARAILQRHGYRVLEASNGGAALLLTEQHADPIHLLLSDVVMPQMSGSQLAERLGKVRPDMRVLFTSGYTDDVVVHHGVLHPDLAFLQKPFTPDALVAKVREVLDAPAGRFEAGRLPRKSP